MSVQGELLASHDTEQRVLKGTSLIGMDSAECVGETEENEAG